MGVLVFLARKHQIQRKRNQYQLQLTKVNNQRQKIADQIGQAQKAKTARQNLINSTTRMAQNSIMTMMNQQQAYNNHKMNADLNAAMFQVNAENKKLMFATTTINGKTYIRRDTAETYLKNTTGIYDSGQQNGDYVLLTNPQAYRNWVDDRYQTGMTNAQIMNSNASLNNMAQYMTMQGMQEANDLFNNLLNNISTLHDDAELETLNAIDSQLEQEQTRLETQLQMLKAELDSVSKQLDQEIKDSAPKFA